MACAPHRGVPAEEAIVRHALGLRSQDPLEFSDEGWDSRVYIVNRGEAVFKFPRSPEIRRQYHHELRVLEGLQRINTPVRLPRVEWRDPDLAWFGYRGVVGRLLSSCLPELDARTRQAIGAALGTFLRELHACQIGGLRTLSIDAELSQYQDKYRLATPALDALSAKERHVVQAFFLEVLPFEMHRLGGDLRLAHGDLAPWNIILTDALGVGVIDFGDVSYQDPSKDFSGFGDELVLNAAFEAYAADPLVREKAWLRIRAFPILDLPFYLGRGDNKSVQMCIELVCQRIVRGEISANRPLNQW